MSSLLCRDRDPGVTDVSYAHVIRFLPIVHRYWDYDLLLVGSRSRRAALATIEFVVPKLTWRLRINYGMRDTGGTAEYQVPLALQAVPAV